MTVSAKQIAVLIATIAFGLRNQHQSYYPKLKIRETNPFAQHDRPPGASQWGTERVFSENGGIPPWADLRRGRPAVRRLSSEIKNTGNEPICTTRTAGWPSFGGQARLWREGAGRWGTKQWRNPKAVSALRVYSR